MGLGQIFLINNSGFDKLNLYKNLWFWILAKASFKVDFQVVLIFLDYGVPKVFSPSSHDVLIESSHLPNEFPKFPTAKIENNITNSYSTLICPPFPNSTYLGHYPM
jgi:hypothetical protein